MATVLSRGIDDAATSSMNGQELSPAEEKYLKYYPVGNTVSIRGLTHLRHKQPTWAAVFSSFLPPVLSPLPQLLPKKDILPQHTGPGQRAQQDLSSRNLRGGHRADHRCPRTGGPDESRGRADGTSATRARFPTLYVLPLLVRIEPQPDPFTLRRRLSLASQSRQPGVTAAAAALKWLVPEGSLTYISMWRMLRGDTASQACTVEQCQEPSWTRRLL